MGKCDNCIHEKICAKRCGAYPPWYELEKSCTQFADKSLFVELPCSVEQPIYCLTYNKRDYVVMIPNHRLSDIVRWMEEGRFGTELFPTPEEAEAEIERRTNNADR